MNASKERQANFVKYFLAGKAAEHIIDLHLHWEKGELQPRNQLDLYNTGESYKDLYRAIPVAANILDPNNPLSHYREGYYSNELSDLLNTYYQNTLDDFNTPQNKAFLYQLANALKYNGIVRRDEIDRIYNETRTFEEAEEGRFVGYSEWLPDLSLHGRFLEEFPLPKTTPKPYSSGRIMLASAAMNMILAVSASILLNKVNLKKQYQQNMVRAVKFGLPLSVGAVALKGMAPYISNRAMALIGGYSQ